MDYDCFVSSDLALRNCLLTSDLTVRIGDYGLSHNHYKVCVCVCVGVCAYPCTLLEPPQSVDKLYPLYHAIVGFDFHNSKLGLKFG